MEEPTDPPWIAIAMKELGTKEVPGAGSNPEIQKYYRSTSLGGSPGDDVPWCSAFANWVLEQAGYRGTRRANARSWTTWGQNLEQPKRGCIVVLWRGDIASSQGHVAFYLGSPRPHVHTLLGGNQGDRVCFQDYGTGRVLSYRWPTDLDKLHV